MAKTHDSGDRAEFAVINDLVRRGYKILIPYGHNWRFDVVAYKDGTFFRIQIKMGIVDKHRKNSRFVVRAHTGDGRYKHRYTNDEIDIVASFLEEADTVVYIPLKEFGNHADMSLRREGIGLNYGSGRYPAHYVKDYMEMPS
jgi:Holliday junction resolvase-like predicted endonuclease